LTGWEEALSRALRRCTEEGGRTAELIADRDESGIRFDDLLKRSLDLFAAAGLLLVLSPLIAVIAISIKLDSAGPIFYRGRRVGRGGGELKMLKFRKMRGDAAGPPLTLTDDERLTRVGRFLARSKIDEVPQLWNVLKGEMSLVGPRPEDQSFVELRPDDFREILRVKPGITGLSQLAFARESELLDASDRLSDYLERFLPQKIALDRLYVARRTIWRDLSILLWTVAAVLLRRDVAVNRRTGRLTRRRRPAAKLDTAPSPR
jgi:lipopolysaccharide/colanic/teichoic acid biosynthesis glycosyltransferase